MAGKLPEGKTAKTFTTKQQRFIDSYAGNIKEAAKKAGISCGYARRLITKNHILAKLKGRKVVQLAEKQGKYEAEVGNKRPPKEHQFKPGESGNPQGPPKRRVQLWTYICRYFALSELALEKLDARKLTCAQRWALRIVKSTQKQGFATMDRFARYVIDRDEGRPTEHLLMDEGNTLTDAQCEEIRALLREQKAEKPEQKAGNEPAL